MNFYALIFLSSAAKKLIPVSTMKYFQIIFSSTLLSIWLYVTNVSFGSIPPLGKFLNPFSGFWQNAEPYGWQPEKALNISSLQADAQVYYDERRVPHVFAENESDLFFLQGYLTAQERLWQMEFISYVAGGRISELVGEKALELDRTQRRMGLPWSAQNAILLMENDPDIKLALENYAAGVNAFIQKLDDKKMPLEYKLLNYKPQEWKPYQSALLLKFMSKMLASQEMDFELTNTLKLFGKETVNLLFPDFPASIDPVVPTGTPFNFVPDSISAASPLVPEFLLTAQENSKEQIPYIGSNNWAVHGSKTKTGKPILCNDPHLQLQLPSIWYEMQLQAPGINVYGVTLPGSPCVIIGFNANTAWGVTNSGMDVKDWYAIKFKDENKNEYWHDGSFKPTEKKIDTIWVKNSKPVYDTLIFTHHGPVMYDENFPNGKFNRPIAMRWTAHDPSNELRTFYELNHAKNYDDYFNAIQYYETPSQNFVFASQEGDIAICQSGKFPIKYFEQGKFLGDGTSSDYEWKGYIPREHIPIVKNPVRGFVSSANQHLTDATYPYYYNPGYGYEHYRNRRINAQLSSLHQIKIEDMMKLQNDNFNLHASEILPHLLTQIDLKKLGGKEQNAFNLLAQWDFINDKDKIEPALFTAFWDTLYYTLWDEFNEGSEYFNGEANPNFRKPSYYATANFLIQQPMHKFIDILSTSEVENISTLITYAFVKSMSTYNTEKNKNWSLYKNTTLTHWARIAPFGKEMDCGGYKYAVNAISKLHGPSWRMIVSLENPVKAYGVYPGGESGNPGSSFFNIQSEKWANGEYYELHFFENAEIAHEKTSYHQQFKANPKL